LLLSLFPHPRPLSRGTVRGRQGEARMEKGRGNRR
jgi:hypothetical protein